MCQDKRGRADEFDGFTVEKGYQIPEDISALCLEQEASLTNRELLTDVSCLSTLFSFPYIPLALSIWTIPEDRPNPVAICSCGFF